MFCVFKFSGIFKMSIFVITLFHLQKVFLICKQELLDDK